MITYIGFAAVVLMVWAFLWWASGRRYRDEGGE